MENLEKARNHSEHELIRLQEELLNSFTEENFDKSFLNNICVYACGSLARLELAENSDLDLFFINNSDKDFSILYKQLFFQRLYEINKRLKYADPSKYGLFWDFISKKNLLDIGSREEDFNNGLTARLLLLLESKPLFNQELYNNIIKETVDTYFVDYDGHEEDFHPMYLINDIFRYWFTLTINYEFRRDKKDNEHDKCWKRLKLKYARLLTCFSFIACLVEKNITPEKVIEIIKKSPLERLEYIAKSNEANAKIIQDVKNKYDWFFSMKKEQPDWWDTDGNKELAFKNAELFHNTVVHYLMRSMYDLNPALKNKLDF